jgi:DNA-directed RNA polymerase specialized sigma24 family protein
MSTFSFFPNRKRDIARLIEQSRLLFDAESKQNFAEQVSEVFDPLIDRRLSKAERVNEPLQQTILFELCGLIGTLTLTDTYFIDQYKSVLDDLIDACRWKIRIKDIPFVEMAQNSGQRQMDIRRWITQLRERQKPSHAQKLALLLTPTDQQEVAYRTLRSYLAYLEKQNQPIHTTPLFWLRNGRVQLRINLFRESLLEQIALRVYLFHKSSEAGFIEESLSKVKHWVTAQVAERAEGMGSELTEGINDIVSKVKLEFINKCQRYRADPETFYLDARLTSYLTGFVKRSAAISKLLAAQKQDGNEDELASEGTSTEYTPYDNDPYEADDLGDDGAFAFEASDPLEDQRNIMRSCLKLLCDTCRELITRHYNDGFSQPVPFKTLAIEFGESAKTLESRYIKCMERLKKMAQDAYKKQQLIPYPR